MSAYDKMKKGDREGAAIDIAKAAGGNAAYISAGISAYDKMKKGDREGAARDIAIAAAAKTGYVGPVLQGADAFKSAAKGDVKKAFVKGNAAAAGAVATYFGGPLAGSVASAVVEQGLGTAVERNPKIFTNDNIISLYDGGLTQTYKVLKDPKHALDHWKNEANKLEKKTGIDFKKFTPPTPKKIVEKITPSKEVIKKITPKISTPKVSCCKW